MSVAVSEDIVSGRTGHTVPADLINDKDHKLYDEEEKWAYVSIRVEDGMNVTFGNVHLSGGISDNEARSAPKMVSSCFNFKENQIRE